jgi:peptidylprolyl isomerase
VAKGGYQKRRIAEKKEAARKARKRAERRRRVMSVGVSVIVLGLLGAIVFVAVGGDDANPVASGSPTPTPTATLPTGCTPATPRATPPKTYGKAPAMKIDTAKSYTATMKTNCGTLEIRLLDNAAPTTVNNFVFLARAGFFDGSIFHRVIPSFGQPAAMIQGGDPVNGNGTGDPGYSFGDENMIPFDQAGYLAMANSGPKTNGSQFFVLDGLVSHLNAKGTCPGPQGCHSVFGKITGGLGVVGLIAQVQTSGPPNDRPLVDVVIQKVTISET